MRSDIEIAQACPMQHIRDIAREAGIAEEYLEQYGNYKAKIDTKFFQDHQGPDGKLILVTAITPTPAGEGKTTTTVGLADGLRKIGKKSVVALREPSLGPVFGLKGGAAGGAGASQGGALQKRAARYFLHVFLLNKACYVIRRSADDAEMGMAALGPRRGRD